MMMMITLMIVTMMIIIIMMMMMMMMIPAIAPCTAFCANNIHSNESDALAGTLLII